MADGKASSSMVDRVFIRAGRLSSASSAYSQLENTPYRGLSDKRLPVNRIIYLWRRPPAAIHAVLRPKFPKDLRLFRFLMGLSEKTQSTIKNRQLEGPTV